MKILKNHSIKILLTLALCVIGFAIIWFAGFKFNFFPKRFGIVEDGRIYRSGELSTWLVERTLSKYKIKVIICLEGIGNDPEDIKENAVAAKFGIEKKFFSLKGDGTGDANHYAEAVAEICKARQEDKPVLIRCSAGTQRTGGVVAVYRLLIEKKDTASAIAELKKYGWNEKDNPHLLPYLNENLPKIALLLNQMGVLEKIPESLPQICQSPK